ncbi:MAG: hypothetical protein NW217_17050 [Hyphomicrobiaceae bacterium]|nr:hypothetical protein [Hyphomicrobiaceae bacterium]
MSFPFRAAVIMACAAMPSTSRAADAIVPFTGLVTATCILTVGTPGLLGVNSDLTTLSSSASGGVPGNVAVVATGSSFRVSAIAPTGFTIAPPGGDDNVSFSASYAANGATTLGETPGSTASQLNVGLTTVSVNMSAQKASGAMPAGAYAAEVIVRCE